MKLAIFMLTGLGILLCGESRPAAAGTFTTQSTATQTIALYDPTTGGLATPFTITATGPQTFTVDPTSSFANVTSSFTGNDFPPVLGGTNPYSYSLTNTATTGSVTGTGPYTVSFSLLFTLTLTSGAPGLTFHTVDNAIFTATNLSLPFASGTVFGDPRRTASPDSPDAVGIYDPHGTLVGYSYDRTVTIDGVATPEPATLTLLGVGIAGMTGYGWRRRKQPATA